MALHWDARKCDQERWQALSDSTRTSLIWGTMAADLGRITTANADEFYARLHFLEKLDGAFQIGPEGESVFLTPTDCQAAIGLETNVTYQSRATWLRRLGYRLDRFKVDYARGLEKQEVAVV